MLQYITKRCKLYKFYEDLGDAPVPFGDVAVPELFDPVPRVLSIPSLF